MAVVRRTGETTAAGVPETPASQAAPAGGPGGQHRVPPDPRRATHHSCQRVRPGGGSSALLVQVTNVTKVRLLHISTCTRPELDVDKVIFSTGNSLTSTRDCANSNATSRFFQTINSTLITKHSPRSSKSCPGMQNTLRIVLWSSTRSIFYLVILQWRIVELCLKMVEFDVIFSWTIIFLSLK